MSNYANQEFQRILSNPQNEIISDSLKGRLNHGQEVIEVFLSFENEDYVCQLDSFSKENSSSSLNKISLSIDSNLALKVLSNESFSIRFEKAGIEIEPHQIKTVNCFKYQSDNYLLDVEIESIGAIND